MADEREFSSVMTDERERILHEIRRQGRAAVAAQSSAEACLAAIEDLRASLNGAERSDELLAFIERLIPVLDAFERVSKEAERPSSRPWSRWFGAGGEAILRDGFRMLRAQLEDVLKRSGIEVDREVFVSFDPDRHRVVERRGSSSRDSDAGQNAPGPRVVEVLTPGYRFRGRLLREAHVVVESDEHV